MAWLLFGTQERCNSTSVTRNLPLLTWHIAFAGFSDLKCLQEMLIKILAETAAHMDISLDAVD